MNKLLLLLIFTLCLTGCSSKKTDLQDSAYEKQDKNIIKAEKSIIGDYYETSGSVKAINSSNIASRILAGVNMVVVEDGDSVQKGDLLVVLDNNDILAKAQSAEAAYNEAVRNREIAEAEKNLAEITYKRYKNIYEARALTKQELDEAAAKYNIAWFNHKRAIETENRAKASLDEAGFVLGYSKIYAPISGIVTDKNIDAGDTASPGQVLLTIKDVNNLEIISEVDESYLDMVKKGDMVKIDNKFDAEISDVVSSVDPISRTFKIRIKLAEPGFKDGQYVKVAIPVGQREAIMIPVSAVVKKGQLEGVYDAEGKFRLIKTGRRQGDMIEVLSGLEAGDSVSLRGGVNE